MQRKRGLEHDSLLALQQDSASENCETNVREVSQPGFGEKQEREREREQESQSAPARSAYLSLG